MESGESRSPNLHSVDATIKGGIKLPPMPLEVWPECQADPLVVFWLGYLHDWRIPLGELRHVHFIGLDVAAAGNAGRIAAWRI